MKNYMRISFLTIISLFIFSCDDDEQHELVGTWNLYSATSYGETLYADNNFSLILTFDENNTFTSDMYSYGESDFSSGDWSTSGNNLILDDNTYEYDVSGTTLTLAMEDDYGNITMIFNKQ